MKLFTCTDHAGHYPVGVASVIVAETERRAVYLLIEALALKGLPTDDFTLQEVDLSDEQSIILNDGNY